MIVMKLAIFKLYCKTLNLLPYPPHFTQSQCVKKNILKNTLFTVDTTLPLSPQFKFQLCEQLSIQPSETAHLVVFCFGLRRCLRLYIILDL